MDESLIIRNFGPVREVVLDHIAKVNVFVGESGIGKSTVLKLLSCCQWIYKMSCLRSYFHYSAILRSPFRFRLDHILADCGLTGYLRPDSFIRYTIGSFTISISDGKLGFAPKFVAKDELSLEKVAFISDKRVAIPDLAEGNLSIRHGMFYLNDTFSNFKTAIDSIGTAPLPYLGLKVETKRHNGIRKLYVTPIEGNAPSYSIPLAQSSSGVQSAVAVQLIVDYFSKHYNLVKAMNGTVLGYLSANDNLSAFKASTNIGDFPHRRINIFVEEPEANLFPTNQTGMVEYLVAACLHPTSEVEMNLSIATHSPYVLSALNTLMLAEKAARINPSETHRIMGDSSPIAFGDVHAWAIKDGCSEDIMDYEIEMISGQWIDSASEIVEDRIIRLNDIIG